MYKIPPNIRLLTYQWLLELELDGYGTFCKSSKRGLVNHRAELAGNLRTLLVPEAAGI